MFNPNSLSKVLAGLVMLLMTGSAMASSLDQPQIVITVPMHTLALYSGNTLIRQYPVGVGRKGFPTPTGAFQVFKKLKDPGWENPYKRSGVERMTPGKSNPLGTRWLGFHEDGQGEYGIHGTPNPESVGQSSSHGCVRMRIPDAEELFELVGVGTPVKITMEPWQPQPSPETTSQATVEPFSSSDITETVTPEEPDVEVEKATPTAFLMVPAMTPIATEGNALSSPPSSNNTHGVFISLPLANDAILTTTETPENIFHQTRSRKPQVQQEFILK